MATEDNSGIGGRKTRIRGDSSKDVELSDNKLFSKKYEKKKKDK